MSEFRWYHEDFPVGNVRAIGPHTVDRDEVLDFAGRYDPQPFHLDEEAARGTPFGRLAASGWHTASMSMRMLCDAYLLEAASLGAPGVEDLRWPHPVYPGDTLQGQVTVLASRVSASRPEMGLLQIRTEVFNQDGRLVFTMQGWSMFRRRAVPTTGLTKQDVTG